MQNKNLSVFFKKGIAYTAMASFLSMPSSIVMANTITAGNSGIGAQTAISTNGNITNITSGFVQNGAGMNHFNKFDVSAGGVANLLGADRYINMVDKGININGTLNAFTTGNLPANAMFISPEGMAVGAGGILNVGGLQMITPTIGDYNSLIKKAGTNASNITLTEADIVNLKAGGDAYIQIGGKIYSAGDVVLQAGNGIYFKDGGIISTNSEVSGVSSIGDISLFTNTGDIIGSNSVNIDSSGNLTLSAKNGGIGQGLAPNPALYGEEKSVTPLKVNIAEGKKLNVEVADTVGEVSSFKGFASVQNNTSNLTLGKIKGSNVKITNAGFGTISTTEAIKDVDKVYLNGKNGALNIGHDITAKEIVRLNGEQFVDIDGNLKVTDNGYISVYSNEGAIDMKDATLNMGNIDIKANGGDVSVGNITITQRGPAEGTLRLVDNATLSTGIKAPDTFRFDGVHIASSNNNVVQKSGTMINSAGRVDLTAGGNVTNTVKAADLISATVGGDAKLTTVGTARLGDINAATANVVGDNILVDGVLKAGAVDINATDKLTIRPNTALDADHRTYGAIDSVRDVNITAVNGILASESRPEGPMIKSSTGKVNLVTTGDIKTLSGSDARVTVGAADIVNANGNNINIKLTDLNGKVGKIDAINNINLGADGAVNIQEKLNAGNDVTVNAVGNILQNSTNTSIIAGNDITLKSSGADIGQVNNELDVDAGSTLSFNAKGNAYIKSKKDLNVLNAVAGKDASIKTDGVLTISSGTIGSNLVLGAVGDIVAPNVSVGNRLDAISNTGSVMIGSPSDLTVNKVVAANDVTINGKKSVIIPHDTQDGNIVAGGNVKISAGDSVLNGGGTGVGIIAGGDLEVLANLNKNANPGTIGVLPYNDLVYSINVIFDGALSADEIGVADANKILNINRLNAVVPVDPVNPSNDDTLSIDERDQKNLKILTDDPSNSSSARNGRQDLRYNVASSEYVLINSDSDSGAKVQDVLNISKQGMLVQTNELPKVGENIEITMDYKGLPFTVEGKVVRTDALNNTAGIQFNNIDQFTSSMILYLGMMNGR